MNLEHNFCGFFCPEALKSAFDHSIFFLYCQCCVLLRCQQCLQEMGCSQMAFVCILIKTPCSLCHGVKQQHFVLTRNQEIIETCSNFTRISKDKKTCPKARSAQFQLLWYHHDYGPDLSQSVPSRFCEAES